MAKYLFESSTTGEIFYTPIFNDEFVLENVLLEVQPTGGGFDLYLEDTQYNLTFPLLTLGMTNLTLNINVQNKQRIKIVTRPTTGLNKILLQGRIY